VGRLDHLERRIALNTITIPSGKARLLARLVAVAQFIGARRKDLTSTALRPADFSVFGRSVRISFWLRNLQTYAQIS
jgi:hypothetical protein